MWGIQALISNSPAVLDCSRGMFYVMIHVTNFIIHHIMIYSVLINTNIQPCFYISGPSETRCGGNELGNPISTFCYSG